MSVGILWKSMAALAFASQMIVQGAPSGKQSLPGSPVIAWHTAGEITLPFEYFRQHIYVNVSIDGRSGYVFMLDSGANRNILNLRTSRQLGMKPKSVQQVRNIGFGDGSIYVAPKEDVEVGIGAIPVMHSASVMDLNRFERHFSHATDGMLGYPFFQRFVVKLDFQRKLLTLLPADHYAYRGPGVRVPLKSSRDFALMPVTVGSSRYVRHQIHVVVDTGSNMTLVLYKPFVRALDLEQSANRAQPAKGFGLNGYYPIAVSSLDLLLVGNAETRNLPVDYLDEDEEPGAAKNIPGAIGNGILQSFQAVIFDVPHHRIIFELKPPPWEPGVQRTATAPF